MDKADFYKIQEQSAAYVANYDKIKLADERSSDLDEREKRLNEAEKSVEYIKDGLEKQRHEVFAVALKKKNEAESLIREYEEKVALQNGYLTDAHAKYQEQVDLNERYEISKRLLSEERKKTETLRSEIAGIDKQHKEEMSGLLSRNSDLQSTIKQLQDENNDLKQLVVNIKNDFLRVIQKIAFISNHIKYELEKGDLSEVSQIRLKGAQKYAEEICKQADLPTERREYLDNLMDKRKLSREINDIVVNIKDEILKDRENEKKQEHHHGMSL